MKINFQTVFCDFRALTAAILYKRKTSPNSTRKETFDRRKLVITMKKRVKRSFKIRMGNRIAQELELPVDVISDTPRITLLGSEHAEIKNHKGVFSYDTGSIRLETSLGLIEIKGDKLEIREIDAERLLVSGKITGTVFLDIT